MKGLAPKTGVLFDAISRLDCIKDFTLVGGTALALQIGTRESEDLDFMSWRRSRDEKREVDWPAIKKELEAIGNLEHMEIYDLGHVEFVVDGVKISFYANPNYSPVTNEIVLKNNLKIADVASIGVMKMEVMLRRSKFRDYYDIYSILEAGADINSLIDKALKYSGHKLKTKNLIAMLTKSERFEMDANFDSLNPIYDITPKDIEERIKKDIKEG